MERKYLLFALIVCAACSQATTPALQGTALPPAASATQPPPLSQTPGPESSPAGPQAPSPTPVAAGEVTRLPSPDGRWTAILDRAGGSLEVEDSQGVKHTLFPAGSTVNDAQWSLDGNRLAVALTNLPEDWQYGDEAEDPPEIHFVEIKGNEVVKAESFFQAGPEARGARILLGAWSPDNFRILFWIGALSESLRADGFPLYVLDSFNMRWTELSEATMVNPSYQSWSPDGSALVFTDGGYRSAQVGKWLMLYEVNFDLSESIKTLVGEQQLVPGQVAWSPAGTLIAFAAVERSQTGGHLADSMSWDNPAILARRIYLYDRLSGEYRRLDAAGAYQDAPRWSADRKTLYYVQMDGDQAVVMAADPETGEAQLLDGCQAPLPPGAGYYGQVDWTELYERCPETSELDSGATTTYTDPAGQFRVRIPTGWQPGDEEGVFYGSDGALRMGYLPEMAFTYPVYRVCESLANTPGGLAGQVQPAPLANADACQLLPLPEMSTNQVKLVVENPAGAPEQRYIYLESDEQNLDAVSATFELLNPTVKQEAFPYPAGPMRPEDETFWSQTGPQPDELTVEEYPVVDASIDSPTHIEFLERIPEEVLQKRAAWREGLWERRLAENNALLEPFGYALECKASAEVELYQLYRGEQLLLDDIGEFWPASVSASGSDFALAVGIWNDGYRLVRQDNLEEWDPGASQSISPVFSGEDLLQLAWDPEQSQVQVLRGGEQVFAFAAAFLVAPPIKGLWSWQGSWLLEVDGFLVQDGEILNERLGFDEIFGWQLLDGKPFYYFRKGPRVGIAYGGKALPLYYEEIPHYRCCEQAVFNNAGNESMAWFYGRRTDVWYYVEIGVYK